MWTIALKCTNSVLTPQLMQSLTLFDAAWKQLDVVLPPSLATPEVDALLASAQKQSRNFSPAVSGCFKSHTFAAQATVPDVSYPR